MRLTNPSLGVLADGNATATILDDDCATPTLVTAFQAESHRDRIELRWRVAAAATHVIVERAASEVGPWRTIAAETREESGTTIADDRDVVAEAVYWYRLVARHADGSESINGPISAAVSGEPVSFGLKSIRPNPSAGPTRIEFMVGRESSVRLNVSDVQGREVAVLGDGVQRSGAHVAFWNGHGARGPLAGGLYFVRYLADGRSWTRRIVLAG